MVFLFCFICLFFTSLLMKLLISGKNLEFFLSLAKVCLLYLIYHSALQFSFEVSLGILPSIALYTWVCPCVYVHTCILCHYNCLQVPGSGKKVSSGETINIVTFLFWSLPSSPTPCPVFWSYTLSCYITPPFLHHQWPRRDRINYYLLS